MVDVTGNVSLYKLEHEDSGLVEVVYEFSRDKGANDEELVISATPLARSPVMEDAMLYGIRVFQHNDVERVFVRGEASGGFYITVNLPADLDYEALSTLRELEPPITTVTMIEDYDG